MHRHADPDDDEPSEEEDEEEEEEEPAPRRRAKPSGSSPRRTPPTPPRPIRRWRSGASSEKKADDEEFSLEAARQRARRPRSVYWRFRDSYMFAPIVAVIVVVLILGGLLAYTQSWPPIYVVESSSMQHGPNDQLGIINAGDLVLSQKVSYSSIVTYVSAMSTGYRTYGEYGDVILYQPNGGSGTPVIHRALIYLEFNSNGSYNAPSLAGLPCGSAANHFYTVSASVDGCGPYGMRGTLTLYGVGWLQATVPISLTPALIGAQSGYVTLGDNNFQSSSGPNPGCSSGSCIGETDQTDGLSQLVPSGWTLGVARGMIPWFGGLRLLLTGNAGDVPSQSWELMALTVVAIVLAAFALHYAWKSFRPPNRRRAAEAARREKEEEEEDEDAEESESPRRSWFHRRARGDDEDEGEKPSASAARSNGRKSTGRPSPSVRRDKGSSRSSKDDSDEL